MADDKRRAGDWQRKDLREDANDLMGEPDPRKWYDRNTWIVFFLFVFWPVGVVLAWRSNWHVAFKIIATVFVAVAVYVSYNMSVAVSQMQLG